MIRSILFIIWLYGLMIVMGLACLPTLLLPKKFARACVIVFIKLVRWGLRTIAGVRTEIRGTINVSKQARIVAAKHHSMWDTLLLQLIFNDLRIIMKRELLYYPIFGWYALKLEEIPIDRDGSMRTLKKMMRRAKVETAKGASILIFPEGTRTMPGAAPDYYSAGVSGLYTQTGLPITPVATNAGCFWPGRGIRRHKGTIIYEVLPEIPPGLDRLDLMRRLEDSIETASNALLAESRTGL